VKVIHFVSFLKWWAVLVGLFFAEFFVLVCIVGF
jgi:hypothetical protein